jgi:hypothetical protein
LLVEAELPKKLLVLLRLLWGLHLDENAARQIAKSPLGIASVATTAHRKMQIGDNGR